MAKATITCHLCGATMKDETAPEFCKACGANFLNRQEEFLQKRTNCQLTRGSIKRAWEGILCLTNQRLFFVKGSFGGVNVIGGGLLEQAIAVAMSAAVTAASRGERLAFSIPLNNIRSFELGKFSVAQASKISTIRTTDGSAYEIVVPERNEWKEKVDHSINGRSMKRCLNCNAMNAEVASFCSSCGSRFDTEQPNTQVPQQLSTNLTARNANALLVQKAGLKEQKAKCKKWMIALFFFLAVFIISFVALGVTESNIADPIKFDKNSSRGEHVFLEAAYIYDFAQKTTTVNSDKTYTNYYLIELTNESYCVAEIDKMQNDAAKIYFSDIMLTAMDSDLEAMSSLKESALEKLRSKPNSVVMVGYGKKIPSDVVNLYVNKSPGADENKFDSNSDFFANFGSVMLVERDTHPMAEAFGIISAFAIMAFIPTLIIFLTARRKMKKMRIAEQI